MVQWRWLGRGGRRRALALGAALLVGWATLAHAPASARHTQLFPALPPATLAHHLADFSNHALLYPAIETWAIESEWSNYTTWRYEVSYRCGARCAGRATVTAHAPGAPQHAPAPRHRVLERDAHCTRLPALPWPQLCEETETETLIEAEGRGSRLAQSAQARCSLAAALLRRCADGPALLARTQRQLRALTDALATRR